MYQTKNDLSEQCRKQVIELLSARLADCIDLQLQAKQAHWNVKGPNFIALHKLFDEVTDTAEEFVDLIAERIVQLGGIAEGTVRVAGQRSALREYPLNIGAGKDHADAVSNALAASGKLVRSAIGQTAELGDIDTSDLFTEVSRGIDKQLWFVEAHLHGN
jgi:starvation-inducible DNA-binding protein